MSRCQVVRYRAQTEAEARLLADADTAAAARAGFVPDDAGRWQGDLRRPALVVTYRYSPPATITRSILTVAAMAQGVAAVDAAEMATAGYAPAHLDWRGTSSGGKLGKVGGPMEGRARGPGGGHRRGEGRDTLKGIEDVTGSRFADLLWGDDRELNILNGMGGDDRICGSGGRDALEGRGGDDLLDGGPGWDNLLGGSGHDTCISGNYRLDCES